MSFIFPSLSPHLLQRLADPVVQLLGLAHQLVELLRIRLVGDLLAANDSVLGEAGKLCIVSP
jgi:hypothetical protein